MFATGQIPAVVETECHAALKKPPQRTILLNAIGLILGIVGLGLAVFPSIVLERPIPNPFETPEEMRRRTDGPPLKQGGVAIKLKEFEIHFGGKEIKNPAPPVKPPLTNDPVRWCWIAGCICALISLIVSSVAHGRERHTVMTITAMSCSVAAITWPFLVIGIVLGLAVGVFLLMVRLWL